MAIGGTSATHVKNTAQTRCYQCLALCLNVQGSLGRWQQVACDGTVPFAYMYFEVSCQISSSWWWLMFGVHCALCIGLANTQACDDVGRPDLACFLVHSRVHALSCASCLPVAMEMPPCDVQPSKYKVCMHQNQLPVIM